MFEALQFDPYDYGLHDDPYPVYARLRNEAPLYYSESGDFWVLSRHADVEAALRDDVSYSNRMGVSLDASAWNPEAHRVMSFSPSTAKLRDGCAGWCRRRSRPAGSGSLSRGYSS